MTEIWANIPNYEDYQISNLGNVCSYKNGKRKLLKGLIQNTGYLTVSLNNKKISVHRLVAITFIHKPKGKNVVNHIDGNKLNNNIYNLEWCTTQENISHAFKNGLMDNAISQMKVKKIRAKRIGQFNEQWVLLKEHRGSVEAENHLKNNGISVSSTNIRQVCVGKRQHAGGYRWKYLNEMGVQTNGTIEL